MATFGSVAYGAVRERQAHGEPLARQTNEAFQISIRHMTH